MTFKTITRRGRDWLWPEYDTELIKVFDQVDDIDTILEYCPNRRVAIQAGGACGVWPWRLSQEFETVITFEPDWLNYQCLTKNAPDAIKIFGGFSWGPGPHELFVCRVGSEATNAGAGYTTAFDGVFSDPSAPIVHIDQFRLQNVGLICLDVEGAEADGLNAASETISRCKPTVVIEEKPLPQGGDYLAARRLLESWGYKERARFHRDVLFSC